MQFELLLKGAHVIDPKNSVDVVCDVAIEAGKIAAVDKDIPTAQAKKIIQVDGLYVTPGLVDIHVHLYATPDNRDAWAGDKSILPDGFSFRTGVTTMVDTGSAGWRNLDDFRNRVIDRCDTRAYALVNIAGLGMATDNSEQNVTDLDPEKAAAAAREHEDIVIGIKTAHYWGPDWTSVDRTLAAGKIAELPIMVDFGYFQSTRPYYELVGQRLRPGDISTHMYRGPIPICDADGNIYPYLWEARKRGILFDLGHGAGSFVWANAIPCIEQGFYPDAISTDLHTLSMNVGMLDMVTTMSKCLVMGMSLQDVVKASTIDAATVINRTEHGHLTVGNSADIAVLNLLEGNFGYLDSFDGRYDGNQRLLCELTIKDGQVVWDWNGRSGVDYKGMGDNVGIREGEERTPPK